MIPVMPVPTSLDITVLPAGGVRRVFLVLIVVQLDRGALRAAHPKRFSP